MSKVIVTEVDVTTIHRNDLATSKAAIVPVTLAHSRRVRRPVIRLGRFYTLAEFGKLPASYDSPASFGIPRKFRFNTRRAAKRFFSQDPLPIRSEKQMQVLFGVPKF